MDLTSEAIRYNADSSDSLYGSESERQAKLWCNHESGVNSSNSDDAIDFLCEFHQSSDNLKVSDYGRNTFSKTESRLSHFNSYVDSLYCSDEYITKTSCDADNPGSSSFAEGDTTPYKNIDMIRLINAEKRNKLSDVNKKSNEDFDSMFDLSSETSIPVSDYNSFFDYKIMEDKSEMSPAPAFYLYHPQNCPLHKGSPPRLSPVGAISPPHRSGPLSPGASMSRLGSPLFPRSHTLPALSAPLYYPYLYTPQAPTPLRETLTPSKQSASTVRSLSFAGSAAKAAKAGDWMGEDVRPLGGDGLSSLCLQEKRALVTAVGVAVEAILAQFSSSRTLVQKALSGDSSVNPTLGRLVLQCLCPAMHNLLCDGIKPHQSDLITGRRPNSPWGLVQASTKLGPNTQALCNLQAKVAALPQLKQSRHRFNAFLFGLLNIKRLDYWLLHLQTCYDVLEGYYYPTAFMNLSGTFCQPLFDELLLMLQPLSLLTFNLDLLFQHHHLDPLSPELAPASHNPHLSSTGQSHSSGQHLKSASVQGLAGSVPKAASQKSNSTCSPSAGPNYSQPRAPFGKGETSPQLQWLHEKEIIEPPNMWSGNSFSQQAGQALQQGWGVMIRWGERLGQNWTGFKSGSSEETEGCQTAPNPHSNSKKTPGQELQSADAGPVPWGLGRLFGATKSPNNPPPTRLPSHWLSPGVTVLSRLTSSGHSYLPDKIEVGRKGELEKTEESKETEEQPKPLRSVRALCDHTGKGTELSFRKGEELLLLGGVDQDWIRCRQGDKEGLVPIGYASLIM